MPRVIARLDIKNEFVIKGIHLEGLRKIGDPIQLALNYFQNGIDEIILIDSVATLYGRNNIFETIQKACEKVFIPITIGGGIRTLDDVYKALDSGADKVAINTAAINNPRLIEEVASRFGSQAMVCYVEAKKIGNNQWECFTDNGRESTGKMVLDWVKEAESRGAGELLVTSIDSEGTKKGFDIELYAQLAKITSIPMIASGGCGNLSHLTELFKAVDVQAVALASVLHYNHLTIDEIKNTIQGVSR
jgi:cyclase